MTEPKKQSILTHLRELRSRLLWSAIAVLVTTSASFFFADEIIEILKGPAGDIQFVYIEVTEGFSVYMRVCLLSGIVAAMPVIMYQLLIFIMPALNTKEKRAVLIILPWIILMFLGGIYFGYRFLLPPALGFLLGFGSEVALMQPRLGNYIDFVTRLLLVVGLIFELPVVTSFLARMGVISSRWLAGKRKIAIIGAFVLAAVVTPTPDIVNQTIVAGTLIVLYEVSIWLAWLVEKRKKAAES